MLAIPYTEVKSDEEYVSYWPSKSSAFAPLERKADAEKGLNTKDVKTNRSPADMRNNNLIQSMMVLYQKNGQCSFKSKQTKLMQERFPPLSAGPVRTKWG